LPPQRDAVVEPRLRTAALYDAMTDSRELIARLTEQAKRLDRDFDKASRLYTFLTGS